MRHIVLPSSVAALTAVTGALVSSPVQARPGVTPPPVVAVCAAQLQGTGTNYRDELLDQLADYALRHPEILDPDYQPATRARLEAAAPACVQLSDAVAPMPLADRVEIIASAHPLYGAEATRQVLEGCTPPLSAEALVALWRPAPSPFRLGRCGQSVDAVSGVTPTIRVRISTLLINNQPPPAATGNAPRAPIGPRLEMRAFFETRGGSEWGLGTRIVGGSGGREVKIVEAAADQLFGGSLSLEFPIGDRGASFRIGAEYGAASDRQTFSAPAGGSDFFGHTYLEPVGSGSSASTGLFAGNSFAVTAEAEENLFDGRIFGMFYVPPFDVGDIRSQFGVGLTANWRREEGEAEVAFTSSSSSSSPIVNFARYELESRTIAAQASARFSTTAWEPTLSLIIAADVGYRTSEGEVTQQVTCPPCSSGSQSNSFVMLHREEDLAVGGSAELRLDIPVGPRATVSVSGEVRTVIDYPSLRMPDSPAEQPAGFEGRTDVQRQLRFGARYSF